MSVRIAPLIAGALLAAALPAHAQPAPAPTQETEDRRALGLELAQLLNSEAATMTQIDKVLRVTLPEVLAANPDFAALEQAYPGIGQAMIDAMAPVMIRHIRAMMPGLWDELGAFYASELTRDELGVVLAFYRGPAGTRIIAIMAEEMDLSAAIRGGMEGRAEVSASDMQAGMIPGLLALMERLTSEERADTEAFAATPAGRKMRGLVPRVQALTLAWTNRSSPEMEAELEQAVMEVVERFIGGAPTARFESREATHG